MSTFADQIHTEARRLPADLARQVYDFICFIETQHGMQPLPQKSQIDDWEHFFDRHARTVADSTPLSRDEIYADRLR